MTDTAPAVASSSRGLLPPVLSASSFGGPSPSFQKAEHERKERTLSDASSGGSGTEIQTFDPEKAFGERRGSRSASTGSAGSAVGQQQQAREAVRDEARKSGAKDRMGAVEEDSEEANTTSAIEEALAPTKASGSNGVINLSPVGRKELASYALTPGLDDIPFSFEDGGASAGGSQKVKSPLGGSD